MFTGIIEEVGEITAVRQEQGNKQFTIASPISSGLTENQSVAHDGVCLSVTTVTTGQHTVTAIQETLKRTNLSSWKTGHKVNLERAMQANDRFEGHIVQGHVDDLAECTSIESENGSWKYYFKLPNRKKAQFIIDKGSIAVNGVSLTVVCVGEDSFSVALIPYTCEHTNFRSLGEGDLVNIEYDLFGKYIAKLQRY